MSMMVDFPMAASLVSSRGTLQQQQQQLQHQQHQLHRAHRIAR